MHIVMVKVHVHVVVMRPCKNICLFPVSRPTLSKPCDPTNFIPLSNKEKNWLLTCRPIVQLWEPSHLFFKANNLSKRWFWHLIPSHSRVMVVSESAPQSIPQQKGVLTTPHVVKRNVWLAQRSSLKGSHLIKSMFCAVDQCNDHALYMHHYVGGLDVK